jgi:hypothetical protein
MRTSFSSTVTAAMAGGVGTVRITKGNFVVVDDDDDAPNADVAVM